MHEHMNTGAYILENIPPPWRWGGGGYQPMSFGAKNMKQGREKRGNININIVSASNIDPCMKT
jgi:hypothetical protein